MHSRIHSHVSHAPASYPDMQSSHLASAQAGVRDGNLEMGTTARVSSPVWGL